MLIHGPLGSEQWHQALAYVLSQPRETSVGDARNTAIFQREAYPRTVPSREPRPIAAVELA